ncbi:MAG: CHAT domain-containing protein, partial [Anaerolineales bacterium]
MTHLYRNLELILEKGGSGYQSLVKSPNGNNASVEFEFPFSGPELENFILRMGQSRRGVRRVDSPQMQAAKAFGIRLFEAIFSGQVHDVYQNALHSAERDGYSLRLLLRSSDVPELVNVPWEYIYDPSLGRFLALSVDTPVVRYLDASRQILPFKVQTPLRVLTMISSPREYPQLDVEAEWEILNGALGVLVERGQVSLTRLVQPTLPALQEQLRKEEYHVFHFIGHSTFSEFKADGLLLLEDERGAGTPVSGHYLGTLLHDEKTLRLAVLNACEGARTSASDPYAGVAQQLVRQGIPAVIAMQFEISERTAVTLAR